MVYMSGVIEKVKEKLFGKKKSEPLEQYAIIVWSPLIQNNSTLKGNRYKEVHIVEYGVERVENYSNALIEMLNIQGIPIKDTTLGLERPAEFLSPTNMVEVKFGASRLPKTGIPWRF